MQTFNTLAANAALKSINVSFIAISFALRAEQSFLRLVRFEEKSADRNIAYDHSPV